ncbi:MAG: hypothetical protein VX413_07755 [Verrucomicrobiota bacterium]|nr:hypothetical protein [Verrucomicrobiota bacterium]
MKLADHRPTSVRQHTALGQAESRDERYDRLKSALFYGLIPFCSR